MDNGCGNSCLGAGIGRANPALGRGHPTAGTGVSGNWPGSISGINAAGSNSGIWLEKQKRSRRVHLPNTAPGRFSVPEKIFQPPPDLGPFFGK